MSDHNTEERGVPKVVSEDLIGTGKWLKLMNFNYIDQANRKRVWETLVRTTHGQAKIDAVEILPILKRKGQSPQLVAIKQFRPPVDQYILELPAGLLDPKEDLSVAALRELKEETGYVGKVVDEGMKIFFGMAISNTSCAVVTVEIDGDLPENVNPKQELADGEYAEVVLISFDNIIDTLEKWEREHKCGIDGKIWTFAHGIRFASFLK
eukprot:TRINITY_DN376_c0_g1_i1.p1 TRINITY_DN376_c0_g1~~TRINITY_DN376_c0_g1_i1.p1  ORF type:complete len:209 (+),score=54.36 TRINITY_DN376_c0_g1_i1:188-814(+)